MNGISLIGKKIRATREQKTPQYHINIQLKWNIIFFNMVENLKLCYMNDM